MTLGQRREIARAIAAAEAETSGRIAVRIVPDKELDAFARAKQEFTRAGLHRHGPRNAALVLVAPKAKRYSVIGDKALHESTGDAFWRNVVTEMQPFMARGDVLGGVLTAIDRIGTQLHAHFAVNGTER